MINRPSFSFGRLVLLIIATALLLIGLNLSLSTGNVRALSGDGLGAVYQSTPVASPLPNGQAGASPTPAGPSPHATGDCYACHSQPGMFGKAKNGELVSLTIDPDHYTDTTHSSCVFCHGAQRSYPHETSGTQSCAVCHWDKSGGTAPTDGMVFDLSFEDARAVSLSINDACRRCHEEIFNLIDHNVHSRSVATGNRFLPACVDCHGLHNIQDITREGAVRICAKCHNAEFIAYSNSVHGSVLLSKDNEDVPVCDDCHGFHESIGISDGSFRVDSYEACGKCHSDQERMDKYGISTAVLSTYLDDFHGRSADLFGQPGASKVINATCYDCHGVHNILPPDDPNSKVSAANLQATCAECHLDASANFPQAWLSHKKPSLQELPGLYITNMLLKGLVAILATYFIIYILFSLGARFIGGGAPAESAETEQGKK
jgi:hypothetical protein